MRLKEVEKLNKGAFLFLGMDWDMGGWVVSWNKKDFEKYGVSIRFGAPNEPVKLTPEEEAAISGDIRVDSSSAVAQKLNPVVSTLALSFRKPKHLPKDALESD